jgi:CRISPR/Cas system CSM-associated protein Csm3 (group 7 of RAMP superfamily)
MISLRDLANSIETYSIIAEIDTAVCVGAGGSSGSLADKPIIRNAAGNLLIPASQLKGRLRHECEKIARGLGWPISESPAAGKMVLRRQETAENQADSSLLQFQHEGYCVSGYERTYHCLISQIFGDPVLPSRIIIDDLICTKDPESLPEVLRPGVSLNRRRRTAEDKKLYLLETSPANAQIQFEGYLHLQPGYPKYAKPLILSGLHHISALGGSKSAGLGWLRWVKLPEFGEIDQAIWKSLVWSGQK